MKYIAHRGYSLENPDNSLEAIGEAIRRKYDGIEIDIQLCKTGEIVLFHDIYIGEHFIDQLTLEELEKRGVISLNTVYSAFQEINNTVLYLDIKGNNPRIIDALHSFYEGKCVSNVYFCSFNRTLIGLLNPSFKRGVTFEAIFNEHELEEITRGVSVVFVHWTCLCTALIEHCKKTSIQVYSYTHKDTMELQYMLRYNIDGIITNGL